MTKMRIILLAGICLVLAACYAEAADELVIYRGDLAGNQYKLSVGSWGSGTCEQVESVRYSGPGSLKILTHGFYSGARLDFGKTLDLTALFGKPNTYLELWLRPSQTATATGTETAAASRFTAMTQLRVVLYTPRGQISIDPAPLRPGTQDRDWWRIDLPLHAFQPRRLIELTTPVSVTAPLTVTRMLIFGDNPELFYLGELKVVTDAQAIRATAYAWPEEGYRGSLITFIAEVEPGAATTKVVWDFDSGDGVQEEAVGERIQHIYYRVGSYKISYKVVDVNGQKAPVTGTFTVRITQ